MPTFALPILANIWLAKKLVKVLVAHELVKIGNKNELELARSHSLAKLLATIQTKAKILVMAKKLARCVLVSI